jgi:hypothetical protein
MDPELPVAPEPPILAAELAAIASELAGAPPEAKSTAATTINN